jgi:hypothetical protein
MLCTGWSRVWAVASIAAKWRQTASQDAIDIIWDRWINQDYTKYLSTILVAPTDLANDKISNPPRSDDTCMPFLWFCTSKPNVIHFVVRSCNSSGKCGGYEKLGRVVCHPYCCSARDRPRPIRLNLEATGNPSMCMKPDDVASVAYQRNSKIRLDQTGCNTSNIREYTTILL